MHKLSATSDPQAPKTGPALLPASTLGGPAPPQQQQDTWAGEGKETGAWRNLTLVWEAPWKPPCLPPPTGTPDLSQTEVWPASSPQNSPSDFCKKLKVVIN